MALPSVGYHASALSSHVCHRVDNYSFAGQDLLSHISDMKTKQKMCLYEAIMSLVVESYSTKYDRPDSPWLCAFVNPLTKLTAK